MNLLPPSAAALSLLLLLPDPARACSCGYIPKPYAERRLEFPAVFHGKVTATEADEAAGRRWIRFAVIKDYSADGSIVGDTATVWTSTQGSACGVYFPVGEEALIFADNRDYSSDPPAPSAKLSTNLCHRNIAAEGLAEALRGMDDALGLPAPDRRTAAPAGRGGRAVVACGQVLFGGRVRADGAMRGSAIAR